MMGKKTKGAFSSEPMQAAASACSGEVDSGAGGEEGRQNLLPLVRGIFGDGTRNHIHTKGKLDWED